MPSSSATESHHVKGRPHRAWLWVAVATAGILVAGSGLAAYAYVRTGPYIVRGVTVAGQLVGGKDALTATHLLEERWKIFSRDAFQVQGGGRTMTILVAAETSSEEEVQLGMVSFEPPEAANQALSYGRRGNWWQQVMERTAGWLGHRQIISPVAIDAVQLQKTIVGKFHDLEKPARNARVAFDDQARPTVVDSQPGSSFDYSSALTTIIQRAHNLDPRPVVLPPTVVQPTVPTSPLLATVMQRDVPPLLARAPFTLTLNDKQWTLTKTQLSRLLGFVGSADVPRLGFDQVKTVEYLDATLAPDINVPAQNAKFSMVGDKVEEFQPGVVGVVLNATASAVALQQSIIDAGQDTAAVVVTTEQPLSATAAADTLGIKELVAEATTNFKGSPTNRRFNLSFGAKILNGLLIQPGEEFSLVKALGPIDAAHGWKPELVIKGAKITPEYGGGLCQVATTMFRVILNAGLPVVERHNHSLRISYYEPPIGLDATIYEPKPDLRFRNDYTTPLLLQTAVEGTLLKFSFYGTKDARTVDIPTPKVYNRVPIPATKNIEVDDLKPGQKECQAPGHPGADATATYTVTKSDGTKVTQVFQSHYRALGVICRIGKKAAPKPTTETTTTP